MFSPAKMMAILLYMDDVVFMTPKTMIPAEAAVEKQFECRSCQFVPTDFKRADVIQERDDISLSYMAYVDTEGKASKPPAALNKLEFHRAQSDDKFSQYYTATGLPACIVIGTSPTSTCQPV